MEISVLISVMYLIEEIIGDTCNCSQELLLVARDFKEVFVDAAFT